MINSVKIFRLFLIFIFVVFVFNFFEVLITGRIKLSESSNNFFKNDLRNNAIQATPATGGELVKNSFQYINATENKITYVFLVIINGIFLVVILMFFILTFRLSCHRK